MNNPVAMRTDAEKQRFVDEIAPVAQEVGRETGVSWKLLTAQAALETNWGEHIFPGTNNVFSVLADEDWKGERETFTVSQYVNRKPVDVDYEFKAFASIKDALLDRVELMRAANEPSLLGQDLQAAASGFQKSGYSANKHYGEILSRISEDIDGHFALGTGKSTLMTDPSHPANELFEEMRRRLSEQSGEKIRPEVAANITKQAIDIGITSVDRLGRVDVQGNDVFIRSANGLERMKADLSETVPSLLQTSEQTDRIGVADIQQSPEESKRRPGMN